VVRRVGAAGGGGAVACEVIVWIVVERR